MQLHITKKALSWCACWVVMGAVAQSSQMAAGGLVALIVCAPVTLAADWLKASVRRPERAQGVLPRPTQLLLPPPSGPR